MDEGARLLRAFVTALPQKRGAQPLERARLTRALSGLCADIRAAWPGLLLSPTAFVAYVAPRLPPDAPLLDALEALHAADLYFAYACTCGKALAIAEFERTCMREVDLALSGRGVDSRVLDEVRQRVRHKLLVADDGAPPKIAEYSGHGELRHWIRVVSIRVALNLLRSERSEDRLEESLLAAAAFPSQDGPELTHLKRLYGGEFKAAFRAAFAALPARQRVLIRQYYLDHLTTIEMGALYHVHAVTALRWLSRTRDRLASETRRILAERLELSSSSVESIVHLVQSQLEVSMHSLLASH